MDNFSWGLSGELQAMSISSSTRSCALVTRVTCGPSCEALTRVHEYSNLEKCVNMLFWQGRLKYDVDLQVHGQEGFMARFIENMPKKTHINTKVFACSSHTRSFAFFFWRLTLYSLYCGAAGMSSPSSSRCCFSREAASWRRWRCRRI